MKRCYNTAFNKLQAREINSSKKFNFYEKRFSNFHLQEEFDTFGHEEDSPFSLSALNCRSKITRLFVTGGIIFVLAKSGLCTAFSRETKKRICVLNVSSDERIYTLFYNKENDSLITISEYDSDDEIICRTTRIEYIRRGDPCAGFQLFEAESIRWPGFVEFDNSNGKIITHCAENITHKVFDLKNYTFLYSIIDKNIQKIITSPGILTVIYKCTRGIVPLKILSVENGTVLKSFNNLLRKDKKVVFITQVKGKLLVKQEDGNLQIVDIRTSQTTQVNKTEFLTPCSSFFLFGELFLTCVNESVLIWNLRGDLVTSFEDHLLWRRVRYGNQVCVTSNTDLIISYCKPRSSDGRVGSINISNISSGKSVGKITASNAHKRPKIRSTVEEALEEINVLFYDEDRHEIYSGNKLGWVHIWTN